MRQKNLLDDSLDNEEEEDNENEITKVSDIKHKEIPIKQAGQRVPASISFTPPVAGLIIAGEVVRDIIRD